MEENAWRSFLVDASQAVSGRDNLCFQRAQDGGFQLWPGSLEPKQSRDRVRHILVRKVPVFLNGNLRGGTYFNWR